MKRRSIDELRKAADMTDTQDPICASPAPEIKFETAFPFDFRSETAPDVLGDDLGDYLEIIDDLNASEEDKIELIRTLCTIMQSIVRLRFGLDPQSLAMPEEPVDKVSNATSAARSGPLLMVDYTHDD